MNPIQINYNLAYSFADLTYSVVRNPRENGFGDDVLPDFFGFRREEFFLQVMKPRKKTLLHSFIFEVNLSIYSQDLGFVGLEEDIEVCKELIESANMQIPEWLNLDEAGDHDLEQVVSDACKIISEAAFQLLFSDRSFLFEFNQMVSKYIALLKAMSQTSIEPDLLSE
jgi:hypothetical protein